MWRVKVETLKIIEPIGDGLALLVQTIVEQRRRMKISPASISEAMIGSRTLKICCEMCPAKAWRYPLSEAVDTLNILL
jgi:hypothetical protein